MALEREPTEYVDDVVLAVWRAICASVLILVWLSCVEPFLGPYMVAGLVAGAACAGIVLTLATTWLRPQAGEGWGVLGLTVLLLAAGAGWYWQRGHENVWIDNGTAGPIDVRFGGEEVGSVGPGAKLQVHVPRSPGPLETVGSDGRTIDHVTRLAVPDRRGDSVLVLNVGGVHCYRLDPAWDAERRLVRIDHPLHGGGRLYSVVANDILEPDLDGSWRAKRRSAGVLRTALRADPCPGAR
jgi:hypothetical protein